MLLVPVGTPSNTDEWLTQDIEVKGNRITVAVNGKRVVNYVDKSELFKSGHIALQTMHGPIQYRKVQIIELPDDGSTAIPTTPTKTTLVLEIEPAQAEVYLDGKLVSASSTKELNIEVAPGKHELKVEKRGFKPHTETVDMTGVEQKRVKVKLEKASPPPSDKEWIDLFNGRNLDGWNAPNAARSWSVKNNALVNHAHGPNLVTNGEFQDFELEMEFLLPRRCNSGVYLRGRYEVQLLDTDAEKELRKKLGAKFSQTQVCGAIYGRLAPSRNTYLGANKWNALKVRLEGYAVTVHLNGTQVVVGNLDAPTSGAMFSEKGNSGPMVLQSHSVPGAQFRNIRLKNLP